MHQWRRPRNQSWERHTLAAPSRLRHWPGHSDWEGRRRERSGLGHRQRLYAGKDFAGSCVCARRDHHDPKSLVEHAPYPQRGRNDERAAGEVAQQSESHVLTQRQRRTRRKLRQRLAQPRHFRQGQAFESRHLSHRLRLSLRRVQHARRHPSRRRSDTRSDGIARSRRLRCRRKPIAPLCPCNRIWSISADARLRSIRSAGGR